MKALKKIISIVLRISVSIILLIVLFRMVDRKNLFEILKNVDKPLLLIAFFIYFASYALCLFRWEMLLKAAKIYLPMKRIIISMAGGAFFSLSFLPPSEETWCAA